MNIQEYDILNELQRKEGQKQRELAKSTKYSLGKVNSSVKMLLEEGYITKDMKLTSKAEKEFEVKRPENAIILAAGFGLRTIPLNLEIPKGLVEVKGEALIERLIKQLHEAGVYKIDIVVGFMKEQYEFLIDEYGVNLIYNEEYKRKNNLYSLKMVEDKINNTYILPCDVWCRDNPFSERELYSWYMITQRMTRDTFFRLNRKMELVRIKEPEMGNEMIGISYILPEEAKLIRKNISKFTEDSFYDNAYWEETLFENSKMRIQPRIIPDNDVHEINYYEQLREIDDNSKHLSTEAIQKITEVFDCTTDDIVEVDVVKRGMTNRSFLFSVRGERYIMRIAGEGSNLIVNRYQEYEVYQKIKEYDFCDPVIYMSPDEGYKITRFIEGVRQCEGDNEEDLKRGMETVRNFHEKKLQVEHFFDFKEKINYYESLWQGTPSVFRDYHETKEKVFELIDYVNTLERPIALTHMDAVVDNLLMTEDKVYLIDWEYAAMQDVHVDLAMFAILISYTREEADHLMDIYFQGNVTEEIRIKIYAYMAICGFLWSNWCEFKRIEGTEFGDYNLEQYRYAKKYYKIVKEYLEEK
ncbi:CTP:phosphocholine cytidylyltransferase-like protein/thiamine kinase-like enzyme [Aequitasia blattaphilus]|uniref:Phosphocholine cytidylyltransferase/choline kinase family protein n=1 Tax=Aequitasia blattaphilus TaxID=2949332 RepID=A0ABT1E6D0_9FIRM|nr:phosphocholine cytidylyltransferase/choline kinase family protein [Aequitasia blattaphilus]MCP1101369.1 phosphocholine cytidylyltransferase/choline kinase family protein [Aequitasia blattaphilus]MCR8614009.1 phosphocholine cytidylyltransferase/choline kinase family protein [Aequitasia blattaphilus]